MAINFQIEIIQKVFKRYHVCKYHFVQKVQVHKKQSYISATEEAFNGDM